MRILGAPRIAIHPGNEGSISIGEQIRLVNFDARKGAFRTSDIAVGLRLFTKPKVLRDRMVALDLRAEESELVGLVDQQYPRIKFQTDRLHIVVRDGDTIAIRGMINRPTAETLARIPLLADFSSIFHGVSDEDEIVLLLTPHIMH